MRWHWIVAASLAAAAVGLGPMGCGDNPSNAPNVGTTADTDTCEPTTCEALGAQCGAAPDGCAGSLFCGECEAPLVCGAIDPNQCGACEPLTCDGAGAECGAVPDGCGGAIDCGDCPPGSTCGPTEDGTPANQCSPAECETCETLGVECGVVPDGCGGTVNCGGCEAGFACQDFACVVDPTTSCVGQCGGFAGSCWCQASCDQFGDCCPDYWEVCEGCEPSCVDDAGNALACGDNGCGGSCGTCQPGTVCEAGQCEACEANCFNDDGTEKVCGSDGCGGVCGQCQWDEICDEQGQCRPAPAGSCVDNCGGNGGGCWCDSTCDDFGDCCPDYFEVCLDCEPSCEDADGNVLECGDNGCGQSCGVCGVGETCDAGTCIPCEQACDGKSCGPDGCGGSCGECEVGNKCEAGQCVACEPQCDGKACGGDGCGGVCGECGEGQACKGFQCVDCEGGCEGITCGWDLCGNFCGDCTELCANPPAGPFTLTTVEGIASEDIAFDDEGNVVGGNDNAIFKTPYGGTPSVWVPVLEFRAGLRYLPTGDLMVNDNYEGAVKRVEPDGTIHVVLPGLSYPNGMEVDLDGFVYVTDQSTNNVYRIEPYAETHEILTTAVSSPNGITFSEDYSKLYVAGFGGDGWLWAIPYESGVFGEPYQFAEVGASGLDGMGVDICGNIYVANFGGSELYRITKEGVNQGVIYSGGGYMPNFQWGSGIGGWDMSKLYIPEGWSKEVREMDLGIPPKKRAFP